MTSKDKRVNNRRPSSLKPLAKPTLITFTQEQDQRLREDAKEFGTGLAELVRAIIEDHYHNLDSQDQN
jgi:predicted DNA-binding protein